ISEFGIREVVFTNPITQSMWLGYIEGHKMTKAHQFGHFIIGKRAEDNRVAFAEHPHIHSKFGLAMDELYRLHATLPDLTLGLYQCVKVVNPKPINIDPE